MSSSSTMKTYEGRVKKVIPAVVNMISGSEDSQQSMEAYNVGKFDLPSPSGKSGGACTAALLQTLYRDRQTVDTITWVELLRKMRAVLKGMGYDQIPYLTSSRIIDIDKPMYIVPPGCTGTKRAILIAINYVGQQGELGACHNDLNNIKEYLINVQGFQERDMLILMDDGHHHMPTKSNIMMAFEKIIEYSRAGDVFFMHYSGHGGRVKDLSGDEDDGYDETIIPVDFKTAGQIIDDDILEKLVKPMASGVTCTVLMDCCHSGTVLDLPFVFGSEDKKMRVEKGFPIDSLERKKNGGGHAAAESALAGGDANAATENSSCCQIL